MLIKLTNTINSIVRKGLSVIRNGLKMWLPFEKSEILGEELVVNGDFSTDSGWTKGTGWTIGSGVATNDGATDFLTYDDFTPTIGQTYRVQYEIPTYTSGISYLTFGGSYLVFDESSVGTFSYTIQATSTVSFGVYASAFIGSIDNVSIKEVTQIAPDKSGVDKEILGVEEVTNGDFAEAGVGNVISQSGGVLVNDSNRLKITSDGSSGYSRGVWETNGAQGDSYIIKADVISTSGTVRFIDVSNNASSTDLVAGSTYERIVTLGSSGKQAGFGGLSDTSFEIILDNISIKEVTQIAPDKSSNSNSAKLFTGKALSFDGVNDYVDLDGFTLDGDVATFAFWINSNDTIGRMFASSPSSFFISFNSNELSIYSSGWVNFGSVTTNEYHRVVITINGTTAKCFVDNVQLGDDKTITAIDLSSATQTAIGSREDGTSPFFNGKLSDFQIYDTAWTQDDVTFDYNNPQHLVTDNSASSITLSNLKGYWHLSEGDGAINYDSSGEDNDGTINGATWSPRQATIPQLGLMDWSKGSNLIEYSEDFSEWTRSSGVVVTDNTTDLLSPSGEYNSSKIEYIDSNKSLWRSPTLSGKYSGSFFVKGTIGETIRMSVGGNEQNFTLSGGWDSIKIENVTATANTINVNTYGGATARTIYLWGAQLEEGSSVTAYRRTNGTTVTDATLIADPNNPSEDILGNSVRLREHSLNLDGIGYAEVPDADSINPTDAITVECWVYWTDTPSGKGIVSKWESGAYDYLLYHHSGTLISFYIGTTGLDSNTISNGWNHIVGTYDKTNMKVYVNGNLDGTLAHTSAIPNGTTGLEIGRYNNDSSKTYSERIDDVRIYDRALSSDEVEQNHKAGLNKHKASSSFSDDFSSDYGF